MRGGSRTLAIAVAAGLVAGGGGAALGATHGSSSPQRAPEQLQAPKRVKAPAAKARLHGDHACPNEARVTSDL